MKPRNVARIAVLLATVILVGPVCARTCLYATADNGAGTNLFGTLNLRTGKFSQIAQTTPLFYALTSGPDGRLYGVDVNTGTIFTISNSGVTTSYGSVTAPGYPSGAGYGFLGLAYRGTRDGLYAVNVDPMHVSLYTIEKHGNKQTDIGVIEGPDTGTFYNGSLVFGPAGKLYFDFVPPSGSQLFTIDPSTGTPTPVGSGLGTDILTLFSDGTELYGIDTISTMAIGIYTINRKTGVAVPHRITVTGLPSSNDYYLDAAAFAPEGDRRECDEARDR